MQTERSPISRRPLSEKFRMGPFQCLCPTNFRCVRDSYTHEWGILPRPVKRTVTPKSYWTPVVTDCTWYLPKGLPLIVGGNDGDGGRERVKLSHDDWWSALLHYLLIYDQCFTSHPKPFRSSTIWEHHTFRFSFKDSVEYCRRNAAQIVKETARKHMTMVII